MNISGCDTEGKPTVPSGISMAGPYRPVRVAITFPDDHSPRFFGCVLLENRDDRRQLKLANDNRRHLIRTVIGTVHSFHAVVADVFFGPFRSETQDRPVGLDQAASAACRGASFWQVSIWRGR